VPWDRNDKTEWFAGHLPAATTIALDARYPFGTAWICTGSTADACGPRLTKGSAGAAPPNIQLTKMADGVYDGTFTVERLTASPPAARPELAVGLDEKLEALLAGPEARAAKIDAEAQSAYDRRDFAGCAKIYARLQSPSIDQLYNLACCLARAGSKEAALDALQAAVAKGFSDFQAMEADNDLAS
jgi:hypothetical protein